MSAIRIIGVICIVVVAIVERIDDYFDGIILPELRVGIIRVEHVILDIGSHIKMILIMGQPKGEAGVVGIGPITIRREVQDPGILPGNDRDALKTAILTRTGLAIHAHRAIGHHRHR